MLKPNAQNISSFTLYEKESVKFKVCRKFIKLPKKKVNFKLELF